MKKVLYYNPPENYKSWGREFLPNINFEYFRTEANYKAWGEELVTVKYGMPLLLAADTPFFAALKSLIMLGGEFIHNADFEGQQFWLLEIDVEDIDAIWRTLEGVC